MKPPTTSDHPSYQRGEGGESGSSSPAKPSNTASDKQINKPQPSPSEHFLNNDTNSDQKETDIRYTPKEPTTPEIRPDGIPGEVTISGLKHIKENSGEGDCHKELNTSLLISIGLFSFTALLTVILPFANSGYQYFDVLIITLWLVASTAYSINRLNFISGSKLKGIRLPITFSKATSTPEKSPHM
ncbi:MAG: hypothetical protein AAGH40_10750 [Verrucomicrobiota bacterium]